MLTEEQKKELEDNVEITDKNELQWFIEWWWDELRMDFLAEKNLPLHSAIYWTDLEEEFRAYVLHDFATGFREDNIELDEWI